MRASIRDYISTHNTMGKLFLALGFAALIVDAVICYNYGVTQSTMHGIGFAVLAFFFALLPDAAASEFENSRTWNGVALGLLCVPLGLVAYQSHLGYSAGIRVGEIHTAAAKNTTKENADDDVDQAKRDIASAEKRLESLGWLDAQVTHDGVRSQIATKEEAIRQEEKKGGCGKNCLKLKTELDELNKRLGAVEDRKDLEARIAAGRRVLAKAKEKAANTEIANSTTVHQNNVAAQLYLAVTGVSAEKAISPDKVTLVYTNTAISGANSLAFMIMAPVGFFVAGRNRKNGSQRQPNSPARPLPTNHVLTRDTTDHTVKASLEALAKRLQVAA